MVSGWDPLASAGHHQVPVGHSSRVISGMLGNSSSSRIGGDAGGCCSMLEGPGALSQIFVA
jgi:hypothetical protein